MGEQGLIKGAYYEFIAFPCAANARYSMPLGVLWGDDRTFSVYRSAGLLRFLADRGTLMLLSPSDPLLFVKSVSHSLEHEVEWEPDGCPRLSGLGGIYRCEYRRLKEYPEEVTFSCSLTEVESPHVPYTRAYGCLVELLVLLTKARAGVVESWYVDYARGLRWCVERSTRGLRSYVDAADAILRELEGIVGKSRGRGQGLQGDS